MVKRLLLGPQRPVRNLGDAVDAAGFGSGQFAVISAGWQEAEGDIDDVHELVRRPLHDLRLYRRAEEVFAADPALHAAYRRRQDRLRELQRLYRVRLHQLVIAARRTLRDGGEPELVAPETRHAVSQLRALDRHHLNRVLAMYEEFDAEYSRHSSEPIAAHAAEIEQELAQRETLLITGGNLAVLLNRLRLFGLHRLLGGCNLIAWSAGAMLLTDLIVLFHDRAAQGRRDPEVLGPGCCVVPDYVLLPDASRRLRLTDNVRVDLFSRRFSPSVCVTLDSGSALLFEDDRLVSSGEARQLAHGGKVRRLRVA